MPAWRNQPHGRTRRNLFKTLDRQPRGRKEWEYLHAPMDVYLSVPETVVQPDYQICQRSQVDGCVFGSPAWICEVVNRDSFKLDTITKQALYEEAGVAEYEIVYPEEESIAVYHLRDSRNREPGPLRPGRAAVGALFRAGGVAAVFRAVCGKLTWGHLLLVSAGMEKRGHLYTGTSNVVVPGPKATFPAAFRKGSRLTYYAALFNSVEINSTFYRIPMPATFEKWAGEVGADFRFTVKLWREISHARDLAFAPEDVERFMEAAGRLGDARGALLIQFPPSLTVRQAPRLRALLEALFRADPESRWPKAVEFRHQSWYTEPTLDLLEEYRCTLVLHDKGPAAIQTLNPGAEFVYLRYHGPSGDYRGAYEADFLEAQAERINGWRDEGLDVYAYFNNTMGAAYDNARALASLCG